MTEQADFVTVERERFDGFLATLPLDQVATPALAPGDLPSGDHQSIAWWVLTINAVNFGSGFFPVLAKRPGLSGSKTVFACLRERFDRDGPLTTHDLTSSTAITCAELFEQDPNGPARELMHWFAHSWRQLGEALINRWDGSATALIEEANGSAASLARSLAGIDGWADSWSHKGLTVPLFKRAQIVPAHLAMAFSGQGLGHFTDLDQLTIFADNLVPHVMRIDGVLRFDPGLTTRIDQEELLEPGSAEEVEIRAVAVHTAELLVNRLREQGRGASAMGLDQVLWNRGAQARYKAHPRHRSRSTAY